METRTVCKASPHIIIYGAREPVPPQQAPWPIKKGSEVWGGGARLRREKCLGRKYFYVLLISGSCLALPRMCFQSGMNSWAQDLERGHEAQALLCGSSPLSPPVLQRLGALVLRVWETFLSWPQVSESGTHRRNIHVFLWPHVHNTGFYSHWSFSFGHWMAGISGVLQTPVRAFWVPQGRLWHSFSPPPSPEISVHCYTLNCFGARPGMSFSAQVLDSFWGTLCGEAGLQSRRHRPKAVQKACFCGSSFISALLWLGASDCC